MISGCFNNDFRKYGDNPVRIYYYTENVFPDFNVFDYAIGCRWLDFGERHMHYSFWQYNYRRWDSIDNSKLLDLLARRKFCNFIYSNSHLGRGARLRQEFCKKLMEYKHVDCPGKVLNNMADAIVPRTGDWARGKEDFIKDYKFTIAFENSMTDGYTTEKMGQPLLMNSVPIYWGNRLVAKEFNPEAFIDANDFSDWDALIQRVIELDNNDNEYMRMLRQNPIIGKVPNYDQMLCDHMLNIFQNGKKFTK